MKKITKNETELYVKAIEKKSTVMYRNSNKKKNRFEYPTSSTLHRKRIFKSNIILRFV